MTVVNRLTAFLLIVFLLFVALGVMFGNAFFRQRNNNGASDDENTRLITDAAGRQVRIPEQVERVICSGSGTLRLLTYLQAQEKVVGVDSIEKRGSVIDTRPYAIANPKYGDLPLFGEFRGYDNPERIIALDPAPQVILRTDQAGGHAPDRLQAKTAIPVVVVKYGDLTKRRDDLNKALRIMGEVLGRAERAEAVISFFDEMKGDLAGRTSDISSESAPDCYVGGIAMRGPHGFHSTEPAYPPFEFTNADNVAGALTENFGASHATVAREQIVEWDPEIIFIDISTTRLGEGAGALHELRTNNAYRNLTAVRQGRVYSVLPYNSYQANFGSIFANAYLVGKVLFPDRFADINPATRADEIYVYLLGEAVFESMNTAFGDTLFKKLNVH